MARLLVRTVVTGLACRELSTPGARYDCEGCLLGKDAAAHPMWVRHQGTVSEPVREATEPRGHWESVPRVGVEPTRVLPHASLSRARLPIPPPRRIERHSAGSRGGAHGRI